MKFARRIKDGQTSPASLFILESGSANSWSSWEDNWSLATQRIRRCLRLFLHNFSFTYLYRGWNQTLVFSLIFLWRTQAIEVHKSHKCWLLTIQYFNWSQSEDQSGAAAKVKTVACFAISKIPSRAWTSQVMLLSLTLLDCSAGLDSWKTKEVIPESSSSPLHTSATACIHNKDLQLMLTETQKGFEKRMNAQIYFSANDKLVLCWSAALTWNQTISTTSCSLKTALEVFPCELCAGPVLNLRFLCCTSSF